MRKFTGLFFVLLLAAPVSSCKNTQKQAIDYNNTIVDLQMQVVGAMQDFSMTFDSNDVSLMQQKHKELLTSIDGALKEISDIEAFDGSTEFKDAAVKLFEFYQDISKKDYVEIIDIFKKKEITQDDVENINKLDEDIGKREKVLDDEFAKVQEAFAIKYGITLIENELQGEIDNM